MEKNIRISGLEAKLQDKMMSFLTKRIRETISPEQRREFDDNRSILSVPQVEHSNLNGEGTGKNQGNFVDIDVSFSEIDRKESIA